MRSFLTRLVLFSAPLVVVALGLEFTWRWVPHDIDLKRATLETRIEELEMLTLGNSYALHGIDPSLWTAPAYNAAAPVQSLDVDVLLARRYLPRARRLRHLIILLSYNAPVERNGMGEWDWTEKDFVRRWRLPARVRWMDHFEWGGSPRVNLTRLRDHLSGKPLISVDKLGFRPTELTMTVERGTIRGRQSAREQTHPRRQRQWRESFEILAEMARLSHAQRAKLVLIIPPGHHFYRDHFDPAQLAALRRDAQALATRAPNVVVLDFLEDPDFAMEHFLSPDHLNTAGARMLTRKTLRALEL